MTTSSLTPLQRFWRLLRPDRREITNVYVYAVFAGAVNLSLPLGIQAIVNLIQGGRVSTAWIVLVGLVVAGIGVVGVLQVQQLRITENLQQRIFARAAIEFTYRLPRIRSEELYRHYAPELMNRFFDVLTVQKGLSKLLVDFSVASLQVVFGLILLSLYDPFFIAFGVVLVLLVLAIFRITARPGLRTSLEESKYKYAVAHWLEEVARTAATFKLAGKTDMPLQRMDRHVASYLGARESHFRILVRQYSLMIVFKIVVALGLLAIGGLLVMEQRINIGQFVAAEIIIIFVMASVEKLVLSLETVYDVLTGLEKIGQVTDLDLDAPGGADPIALGDKGAMALRLEAVDFTYPGGDRPTLSNLDLNVEPGTRLVVTGPNGSGKSTLLHVIAGLFDVSAGTVSYDQLPKGNFGLEALHTVIGDCLTQGQLFKGTILENITIGREKATLDNVRWAVEALGLESFVRTSDHGYDTLLDPMGQKLPRSVVQKLLIARSVVDRPRLLLLEDALDYIDDDDRKMIVDFLVDRSHPWTLVAVSNDDYLIQRADRTVVMREGALQN